MASSSQITKKMADFKALKDALQKGKNWRVKVGIMGSKNERFDIETSTTTRDKMSNSEIGLIQEKGSKSANIPRRSFLLVPLVTFLPRRINEIGRAVWRGLILGKGLEHALDVLGIVGVNIVNGAFTSAGYGVWPPNAPYTIRKKKSDRPLIDKGFLRKSIDHKVVKGRADS